ncbi:MAG: glycosyltransferase family 39 protein [Candidatus Omnitrophota bacterium]|nr:glycosyltransferase family 39 protein [Candidatus Omnitrophota bacterium]
MDLRGNASSPRALDHRRLLVGICLVAFVVRLGALIALDRLRHPDVWESETIALNLLQGRGFVFNFLGVDYRSYMEPLYPALCTAVYAITGHHPLGLGLVHVILGTALVWLVFACARRISPEGAALVAASLAAIHPGLVLYTTKFHPFILDALLLVAVLAGCLWIASAHVWRRVALLGILIGLCMLTRPTVLACAPIIGWWVCKRVPGNWRRRGLALALVAGCAAAVIMPWVWRNYVVHGRFLLTRSGSPMVLWIGNNPYRFTGSALTPEGEAILINAAPLPVREHILSLDELGQQDYFLKEALDHIRAHPGAFLQRWFLKWRYFWWFSPQAGLLYPSWWLRLYQVVSLALMVCVALAIWAHWRDPVRGWMDGQALVLLLGMCASIALLQSVFYIEGRHRLAIEPFLLIPAGHGLWWLRWRQAQ